MLLEALEIPVKAIDNAFKASIAGVLGIVAGFAAGAVVAFKATEKWAGELDSIQDVIGGTAKEAAAFNFVLRKSGVDTGTFTKGLVILGKGLIKSNGDLDTTGKALKGWGIDVLGANGTLKDQSTLMGEISDKYNAFGTQQERVNFLTEVFGKSGANLVDFFDTLAKEGGIDAVAEKVERFGLAIDPGRYEQFNRNLEELKLIGLGLAVGFTEKVMPALEKFLELIANPSAIDLSKIAEWADTNVAIFVKGLGDSINDWVSGGGPEALSENLISWIEGIGDTDAAKSKTQIAMEHLVKAMGNALAKVDWSGIWAVTDAKLDELFISSDAAISEGLGNIDTTFNNWLASSNKFEEFFAKSDTAIQTGLTNIDNKFNTWAAGVIAIYSNWAAGVIATYTTWAAGVNSKVNTALDTLQNNIRQKLDQISQVFYQKAQSWINQAVQSLNAAKQRVLDVVTQIKNAINTILSQIKTSFSLSFNIPAGLEDLLGGLFGSKPKPKNSSGSPDDRDNRASGGPVIAGQSYNVAEFFRPEVFTPSVSGRVDPMQSGGMSDRDMDRLADRIGTVIARLIPAELQKVRG